MEREAPKSVVILEGLEGRLCFSKAPLVPPLALPPEVSYPMPSQVINRVLYVEGTHRADVISLTVGANRSIVVAVNSDVRTYAPGDFRSVVINGGRSDDLISVGSERRAIVHSVLAWGGLGHDTIQGGQGNDELHGQSGWDVMYGSRGNDLLMGESQTDTLRGGDGDDTCFGADGNDLIAGDGGTDVLWGGVDADRFVIEVGEPRKQVNDPSRLDVVFENDGTIFSKS
ncbi:MAG TPA: calcium-binding protein [Tepidisphaeraceae bacterium]|nr:calcium-binding protein [Tepidisphaeraceae bacterium]